MCLIEPNPGLPQRSLLAKLAKVQFQSAGQSAKTKDCDADRSQFTLSAARYRHTVRPLSDTRMGGAMGSRHRGWGHSCAIAVISSAKARDELG